MLLSNIINLPLRDFLGMRIPLSISVNSPHWPSVSKIFSLIIFISLGAFTIKNVH